MSLCPSTLFPLSLCMESASYVLSFRMVFFSTLSPRTGFLTSAYVKIQSINQKYLTKDQHPPSNLLVYSTKQCSTMCVFSSHPFWTSSSLDVPAGVTQEEGHTGFLIHLPSAVRALIFVARRIQPFLSLVDREAEFCVLTN